ncbi:demethoxyubiquinone hydroxylase family protein [bacterium]|nr:demethoxyubiquinone hydroxylase family protein [bacterium]
MVSNNYLIRTEQRFSEIQFRREGISSESLTEIKKGLITLYNLEIMAAAIYQFQISGDQDELNRRLITSMYNEMTHIQDFKVKLYEYGWKPSKRRGFYWIIGFKIGFISRLLGKKIILKAGICVEKKAVHHYDKLLSNIDWDDATRKIIEKDQSDEVVHIQHWEELLEKI